ncbi:hypothetical protein REPUB_Repub09cG0103200 [Reevesia pubescens]
MEISMKGKRSVPISLFTTTNLVIFLIISFAILPEISTARHHNPSPLRSPPSSRPPSHKFPSPPQHNTVPPSPKKVKGGMYYLPPNGI